MWVGGGGCRGQKTLTALALCFSWRFERAELVKTFSSRQNEYHRIETKQVWTCSVDSDFIMLLWSPLTYGAVSSQRKGIELGVWWVRLLRLVLLYRFWIKFHLSALGPILRPNLYFWCLISHLPLPLPLSIETGNIFSNCWSRLIICTFFCFASFSIRKMKTWK